MGISEETHGCVVSLLGYENGSRPYEAESSFSDSWPEGPTSEARPNQKVAIAV